MSSPRKVSSGSEQIDETSFWFRHRNRVILDQIAAHHPGRCLVVEVGSGSGVVAATLQAEGFVTLCVEPHPAGARAAARRSVGASFCGDLESLGLPESSIPVIGAFDVIEHIPDPLPLLGEMRRVLEDDGIAVFTVPAFPWLWSAMDDWNGHQRRYARRSLRSQLEAAGFEVLRSTYLFAPLVIPAFLLRVVRERLGPRRSADEVGEAVQEGLSPGIPMLNSMAWCLHRLEAGLLRRWTLPIGTSVLAVASGGRPRQEG